MRFPKRTQHIIMAAGLGFLAQTAWAQESFTVDRIVVNGLQGISYPTVMSYLPLHIGQQFNEKSSDAILHALYNTGFFSNISLARQGNHTLVIQVVERPTIGLIHITGNKKIPTKKLMQALEQAGIREGDVYDSANLTGITQALREEYINLGRYSAAVNTQVVPEPRNRVGINIVINEGAVAKIREINIIGNTIFKPKDLRKQLQLGTPNILSFFTHNDEYSSVRMDADLERLRSYYLDRGYLEFKVVSKQVAMSPDRSRIYITINVDAGPKFYISGWQIQGPVLNDAAIRKMITLKAGDVFSRKNILAINENIANYYADRGYAFPNINATPTINDTNHTVFLTYVIKPGKLMYVREIHFSGNSRTKSMVLRRQMRQQEGALFNLKQINESKRLLNNLGYLKDVTVKPEPVPGTPDQVDLNYNVTEVSAAELTGTIGYSDVEHFLYGASIKDPNFLGTGKFANISFQHSSYQTSVNLGYVNPFYTIYGVSRGVNVYYDHTTPDKVNLANYALDDVGTDLSYGIPLNEYDNLSFSIGYANIKILQAAVSATQITDFVTQFGSRYNEVRTTAGWTHSNFDRVINPTNGVGAGVSVELDSALNTSSLNYYKMVTSLKMYRPLGGGFILNLNGNLNYGNGIGHTGSLPFFSNFYAGGLGTVPGFAGNTLGPKDSLGNPMGGNILTVGSAVLILPNFISDSVRTGWHVSAGNVFQNDFAFSGQNGVRYSTGLLVSWITPLGPSIEFGISKVLNKHPGDDTQLFNFTMGAGI